MATLLSVSDIREYLALGFTHDQIVAMTANIGSNATVIPTAETAVTPENAPSDNVGAMPIDPHDPTTWTIERLSLKGNGALLKQALLWYDKNHTIADKTLRSALIFGKYPKDDRSYDGLVKADKRIDYLVKAAARIAQSKTGNATVIPTKEKRTPFDHGEAYRNTAKLIDKIAPIFVKYCNDNKTANGKPLNYVSGKHTEPYKAAVREVVGDIALTGDIYGPNFRSVSVKAGVGDNPLRQWLVDHKMGSRFDVK
jgi:hypothetical protein